MSAPMTLEQVRDWHKQIQGDLAGPLASEFHKDCVAAIDAHIAQPAQAVDVDSLMSQAQVFASAWSLVGGKFDSGDAIENAEEAKVELRTMITRALSGEKAGPVGDGVYPVAVAPKDAPPHSIALLVYLPEHGWRCGFYTGLKAERGEWPWSAESFAGLTNQTITYWANLPAFPTPDKEG